MTLSPERTTTPAPPGDLLGHQLDGTDGDTRKDVVLLLNGGMMTYPAWQPISQSFADSYRRLGCDFRGQLMSPGPGHPRLEDNVGDLIALLDALELDRVHAVGTSFGGEIAILLASEHPQRVQSLTVITAADRTPPGMAEDSQRLQDLVRGVLAGADPGAFHDTLVESVYSPAFRKSHAKELQERRQRTLPSAWYEGLLGILESIQDFDLTRHLKRIVCPTLIVHAAHDEVMPIERVRPLADGIAGAQLRIHPTSGHALVLEDPAWLGQVCRTFLDQVRLDQVRLGQQARND